MSQEISSESNRTADDVESLESAADSSGHDEPAIDSSRVADEAAEATRSRAPGAIRKCLGGAYSSIAVVGVILFFLPWMSLSCVGVDYAHQSGFDIMLAQHSKNEHFSAEFKAKVKETLQSHDMDASKFEKESQAKRWQAEGAKRKDQGKAFWLIFYPVGLLLVAGFGPIVLLARQPVRPFVPLIGAVFAAVVVTGTLMYDYPIEHGFKKHLQKPDDLQEPDKSRFNKYLDLHEAPAYTYVVWLTYATLGLVVVHYVAEIVFARANTPKDIAAPS